MPIPFLKFPRLIQLEIFKQLEFTEIFLMSLCSRKVKNMIQNLNLEAGILVYGLLDSIVNVAVGPHEGLWQLQDFANFEHFESIPKNEMSLMNFEDNTIECSYKKEMMNGKELCIVGYHASEEETVLKSLQCHVSSLFRNKPYNLLMVASPSALARSAAISHLNEVRIIIEEPQMLDTSQLDDFMNFHPNLDGVQIMHPFTLPRLSRESKLLKINMLTVHHAAQRTSEFMANFDGKCLVLCNSSYTSNDWYQLLKKWKRKEAYGNLKTLVTSASEQLIILNFDITEFDMKVWDGQRRPQNNKFGVDCSNWLDMQQDGGGKWASIMMELNAINFVVWD